MEKEVIRVWFCNRRQKEKRINPCSAAPMLPSPGKPASYSPHLVQGPWARGRGLGSAAGLAIQRAENRGSGRHHPGQVSDKTESIHAGTQFPGSGGLLWRGSSHQYTLS